jgi:hypothetical protein
MRDPGLEIIERSKKYNIPARKKFKPEPTRVWKKRETPSEFIERKNREREIESLHDTYEKAKDLFKKARDFDYNRHEMLFPKYKNIVHGSTIERVNNIYEKYLNKSRPKREDNSTEENSGDVEEPAVKPASVITDIHRSCEHKITKRREDALHDIKSYCDEIDKINKRIQSLSNAFKDEEN